MAATMAEKLSQNLPMIRISIISAVEW